LFLKGWWKQEWSYINSSKRDQYTAFEKWRLVMLRCNHNESGVSEKQPSFQVLEKDDYVLSSVLRYVDDEEETRYDTSAEELKEKEIWVKDGIHQCFTLGLVSCYFYQFFPS
jgi:hypothetical protein